MFKTSLAFPFKFQISNPLNSWNVFLLMLNWIQLFKILIHIVMLQKNSYHFNLRVDVWPFMTSRSDWFVGFHFHILRRIAFTRANNCKLKYLFSSRRNRIVLRSNIWQMISLKLSVSFETLKEKWSSRTFDLNPPN